MNNSMNGDRAKSRTMVPNEDRLVDTKACEPRAGDVASGAPVAGPGVR
jgi:hypothetical protein